MKANIDVIKPESLIDITISGAFHKRLVSFYFNYAKKLKPKELEKYAKIISSSDRTNYAEEDKFEAFHLETLIMLIKDLEDTFRKKDLVVKEEIELPEEPKKDSK
jgi:hypothetical protein